MLRTLCSKSRFRKHVSVAAQIPRQSAHIVVLQDSHCVRVYLTRYLQMQEAEQKHAAALSSAKIEHTNALAKLRSEHTAALNKLTTDHTAAVEKLKSDGIAAETKLKTVHAAEVSKLQEDVRTEATGVSESKA